jgi:hypothetical protein
MLASPCAAEFNDTLFVAVAEEDTSCFGWFVNSAGDLDDDGYNDIVVGDFTNAAAGNEAGRSYVYFTGPLLDDIPDIVVTGTADMQWCGMPQRAGDMNGDGRDDLAIGAPGYGSERGRVFLFWGGPTFTGDVSATAADVKITGVDPYAPDWLGFDVEPLGDVNRDGLDDLFICTGPSASLAYVFFGDSTLSGVIPAVNADIILDVFPLCTYKLGAGDLDGDSQADLVLGSFDNGGAVYVFLGDSTLADTTLTAQDADVTILDVGNTNFGLSLACDGDFDGDGLNDLAVGAAWWDHPADDDGAVLVFYGRSTWPDSMLATDADWIIEGDGGDAWLAQLYTSPVFGDQDGDGCDDLIVLGHAWNDGVNGQLGRAYLFVGGSARRSGLNYTWEAEHIWTGPVSAGFGAGFGKGGAWIPDVIPGSTGAFAFGATAHWMPDPPGKVYVFDAGQGWSSPPGDAAATAPRAAGTRLLPCRPNPFASTTSIRFELPARLGVSLAVYDVAGRLVRRLLTDEMPSGRHVTYWDRITNDGARVPSGVYFVRLKTDKKEASRKVVVID